MVSDNPREELWGGGLSRERPPYSERSLPRGRPHRNQGHVALAVVSRICPTFSVLVDGALSRMPRVCAARSDGPHPALPIPAARWHGKARSVVMELRASAHLAACGGMASGSFFPAPRVTSAALRARRCPPPWIHRRNAGWRGRVPPRRGRLAETARRPSSSPRESLVASCGDRTH